MAGGTWDKLEQVFEDRVERALSKLGVYTQNDVQRLAQRVDELSAAVNKLLKTSTVKPGSPAVSGKKPAKAAAAKKRAAATKVATGTTGKTASKVAKTARK